MSFSDLVDDINAMLNTTEPTSTDDCCIYKVPSKIRKLNEDAYTPSIVSIGPFHHGHPQLQNMEREKLIYFKDFLQRTDTSLNTLVSYIDSILPDFKRCYSETLPFSDIELVKLILIDSCFIIEHFWSYYDELSFKPWLFCNIILDLMLLENQLPFFVIEKIYSLSLTSINASVPNTNIPSFLRLTFDYFDAYNKSKLGFDNNISIRHFTDLIRLFHLQHPIGSRPSRVVCKERMICIPSATELLEAGVRFQVNSSECLLEWRFSEGVLEIPQSFVGHNLTEILFRNMIALEQFHYPLESYILDYVTIMDFLINTGRDVDILIQSKILENWFGDNHSVANMFNGLCRNMIHCTISSHFSILCKDLNAFCSNRWNKLKASLRRDYGKTPWQTAASIAGIVLLALTLLQTVCSCK